MFKNSSEKGAFGEFAFQYFVTRKGLQIKKTGILEYDFMIAEKFLIDVKTTESEDTRYRGLRVRPEIIYDLVQIQDGIVRLYPDAKSPLAKFSGSIIGNFEELMKEWRELKAIQPQVKKLDDRHRVFRRTLKDTIASAFIARGEQSPRVVLRGLVSKTRWTSSPDNLPGSERTISQYSRTIFIQLVTIGDEEQIEKIFVFRHDQLPYIAMKAPDSRQGKKRIQRVIDLQAFEKDFPNQIFTNINQLKDALAMGEV